MAARDEASILVIEDDEIKRQSIVKAIEEECPDIAIETAHSVRTAVDLIADSKFALVIADMSLPTFDIEIREPGGTPPSALLGTPLHVRSEAPLPFSQRTP